MSNGYSEAMRVFTKLPIKPPLSISRGHGYLPVVFVGENYLQGHTFSTSEENLNATAELLQSLCFTIYPEKPVLVCALKIEFLGFVLNSLEMKIHWLQDWQNNFENQNTIIWKEINHPNEASVIWSLAAIFTVPPYG